MNDNQHLIRVVGIAVIVLSVIGIAGYLLWANFVKEDELDDVPPTTSVEAPAESDDLKIEELGKTVELTDSIYEDVSYEMTSVNENDPNKFVVAIYSKVLNELLVENAKVASPSQDYSKPYWKYTANRAVYAYFYDPPANAAQPEFVNGVASNIIDPKNKTADSKLYVGAMGPGASADGGLNEENAAFLDWITNNLK